jgi:uncharacterized membrane protein
MANARTGEEHASGDEALRAFRARAATRRMRLARATFSEVLVVVDLAVAAMVASSLHGEFRALVGLTFCLVVPGWSIVGLLRLHNAALEAALTVAAGLAALVAIAQLAVTFDIWHLTALQLVVCAACLPSLLWQSLDRRRLQAAPA